MKGSVQHSVIEKLFKTSNSFSMEPTYWNTPKANIVSQSMITTLESIKFKSRNNSSISTQIELMGSQATET